jgi:hypothetical protein
MAGEHRDETMKLFEVETELVAMIDALLASQESGEPVDPQAMARLSHYAIGGPDAVELCRTAMQAMEKREQSLKEDRDEAVRKLQVFSNAREDLKNRLLAAMMLKGVEQANGNKWKLVVKKGSQRVELEDGYTVLDLVRENDRMHLLEIKTRNPNVRITVEPAKDVIHATLKRGEMVYGAHEVTGEPSLQVKPLAARDTPGEIRRWTDGNAQGGTQADHARGEIAGA